MSAVRIGRAFSPENRLGNPTQGVALGWYGTGLWPSEFGSDDAPTAQSHTSLGQRPRIAVRNRMRAEGPTHLTAPCLNRSRIS